MEHHPKPELDHEVIQAFAQTFIPRFDLYAMQLADGSYTCIKKRLDIELVSLHIQGAPTLGAYALNEHSNATWICFDADRTDDFHKLITMAGSLAKQDIPSYVELSRRGGHLWLFVPAPLSGRDARRFGKQLLSEYENGSVELYPKQDSLVTGPGSFIRLPFGKHRMTGHRYHFISPNGQPLAPTIREQITLLAAPERVPQPFIDELLDRGPATKAVSPTPLFQKPSPDTEHQWRSYNVPVSERIKTHVSVFEFVSQYVLLDQHGIGFCPFHDDQHKSFGVDASGNFWHCFAGCGGGSVIDFWMKWREKNGDDSSFKATVTDLARMML